MLHFIGPPPKLSRRAEEQIRQLGTDSALGFQRKRSISRSININNARLTVLRDEMAKLEEERFRYKSQQDGRSKEIALQLDEQIAAAAANVEPVTERVSYLQREHDAIDAWHVPTTRVLESILKELGFTSVEQVLPDFDDGFSRDSETAFETGQRAELSRYARPFGGAR
jgi:hypothetical protein